MAYPRLTIMDAPDAQRVHDATFCVLSEVGANVLHEPTFEWLRAAGAPVEGSRVRFAPQMVDEALAAALGHVRGARR